MTSKPIGGTTTRQQMKEDNMIDFDDGPQGSGDSGPWINWHAREKRDGSIGSRSFSLRDEDGSTDITAKMKKGVAFDIGSLKTGWCFSNGQPGVSPQWEWNESPAKFTVKQPPDIGSDRWKKGFSIRVAVDKDTAAVWSQAGSGAWSGLVHLMKAVKADGGSGEVVVAKMSEVEEVEFPKGGTSAPVFTVVKWSNAPECLKEAAALDVVDDDDDDAEF